MEQPDGSWVLDGEKMFITNAGTELSRVVTITAVTGADEISNLIVENGTPGYEISAPLRKMGWHASDTRALSFQGCRVGPDALLGPRGNGLRQFLEILDGGRISVAALSLGLAQGVLRAVAGVRAGSGTRSAARSRSSRRSSSSSPTWRRRSRPAATSSTTRRG